MTDAANSEVISAFLDNEPFEPGALAQALADPGGRDLLIDLMALRHVVNTDGAFNHPLPSTTPRSRWREFVAAAAVVAALAGGYAMGRESPTPPPNAASTAPQPTRVVDLRPGVEWQPTNGGR